MNKKLICILIAVVVSICCAVSLIGTIRAVTLSVRSGGVLPTGMIMLSLVTLVCTVVIWKGVLEMK